MPRFDKTGPRGEGPMTGRGLGKCAPAGSQTSGRGQGMGFGKGRGYGRGLGGNFNVNTPQTKEEKIEEANDQK